MEEKPKSGTVEQESMEGSELAPVLDDYADWLRGQGFTKSSPKDHLDKLSQFWQFLTQQGLLNQGRINWLHIDQDVIAEYQSFIFAYTSSITGRKLACNTQINYLSYLQSFFRFLKKTQRIALNPTDIIKLPRAPYLLPAALLKPEEMRRLLAVPDVQTVIGFRDRTILEMLWSSAPRLAELCQVSVEDINFSEGLLIIQKGKGDRERVLPLGAGALAWAREYIHSVRGLLCRHRRSTPSKALFLNRYGQPLEKPGWESKMRVYADRARINPLFTTHSFRHQLASDMLKNGADLRHIQQMLGHSDLITTQRYLHVVKGELLKVHGQTHPKERLPVTPVSYRGSYDD